MEEGEAEEANGASVESAFFENSDGSHQHLERLQQRVESDQNVVGSLDGERTLVSPE